MRSDFLISVVTVDEEAPSLSIPRIAQAMAVLARRFRYFEVVYIVPESRREEIMALGEMLAGLVNLRILFARQDAGLYRRRAIAASEAIGDVVVITELGSLPDEDLCDAAEQCHEGNTVMLGWHGKRRSPGLGHWLMARISRHRIDARASRTILLPRDRLNEILAGQSPALDLRFEPRSAMFDYRRFDVAGAPHHQGGFWHRYQLLVEILMSGAPRYLKMLSAFAFLVAILAAAYGVYAVFVVLFAREVAEGWFSTSLVQSGSVFFIASGMSVIALALTAVLERLRGGDDILISGELANTDLFSRVEDLNIELGHEKDRSHA